MRVDIRKIEQRDNAPLERIIQNELQGFGALGSGLAILDEEVGNMFESYSKPSSAYFVCAVDGRVIGGGGVAPLQGGEKSTCELRKMFFVPAFRRRGYGKTVLQACLREAQSLGFQKCYVETYSAMFEATQFYERNGFQKLASHLGETGLFGCDVFYILDVKNYFERRNI